MSLKSMTGFGVGSAAIGEGSLRIELRALNHRYQDIRLRLPGELGEQSFFLEQLARKHLGRGRYDLSVRTEGQTGAIPRISKERAVALYRDLSALRDEVAPGAELSLTALLSHPGLFESSGPDGDHVRSSLETAFLEAANQLDEMRRDEGRVLTEELASRLGHTRELTEQLKTHSAELLQHHAARLRERLARLVSDVQIQVQPERLEQELALLADKSDITEELVRLESHFQQMETLFTASEPVGRKLDFLLQEVGREVNTIGSKSQHAPLAHLVVELKAEMERMREQVQNVD